MVHRRGDIKKNIFYCSVKELLNVKCTYKDNWSHVYELRIMPHVPKGFTIFRTDLRSDVLIKDKHTLKKNSDTETLGF